MLMYLNSYCCWLFEMWMMALHSWTYGKYGIKNNNQGLVGWQGIFCLLMVDWNIGFGGEVDEKFICRLNQERQAHSLCACRSN